MRAAGDVFELRACAELERAGLKLLARNYNTRYGELDLVMLDRGTVVFVEVRYRKHASHGSAAESVTPSKQARRSKRHSCGWRPTPNGRVPTADLM